jgi:hypothetical protein
MRKKLYIHVGKHKTGTTAIQSFLSLNRKKLREYGILYPGKYDNHYPVALELQTIEKPCIDSKSNTYKIFTEISNNINKYEKFMLSSEGFSENDSVIIPRLLETINHFKLNLQIEIVIFLREQDEWLESAYQQQVKDIKTRLSITFQEMISNKVMFDFLDYHKILKTWSEYFGDGNVSFKLYYSKQPKQKIFNDILGILDLPEDVDLRLPLKSKSNIGLSKPNLEFLRWLNLLHIDKDIFRKASKILSTNFDSREKQALTMLSPKLRKEIMEHFNPSNQLIAKNYLNRENGVLFNTNNTSENLLVYEQNEIFDPKLFEEQLDFLVQKNRALINKIRNQVELLISPSVQIKESKKSILTYLNQQFKFKINERTNTQQTEIVNIQTREEFDGLVPEYAINGENYIHYMYLDNQDIRKNVEIRSNIIFLNADKKNNSFNLLPQIGNFNSITIIKIKLEVVKQVTLELVYRLRNTESPLISQSTKRSLYKGLNELYIKIDHPQFNGELKLKLHNYKEIIGIHEICLRSDLIPYNDLLKENEMLKNQLLKQS